MEKETYNKEEIDKMLQATTNLTRRITIFEFHFDSKYVGGHDCTGERYPKEISILKDVQNAKEDYDKCVTEYYRKKFYNKLADSFKTLEKLVLLVESTKLDKSRSIFEQ